MCLLCGIPHQMSIMICTSGILVYMGRLCGRMNCLKHGKNKFHAVYSVCNEKWGEWKRNFCSKAHCLCVQEKNGKRHQCFN